MQKKVNMFNDTRVSYDEYDANFVYTVLCNNDVQRTLLIVIEWR